jgi:hypothetical protein
MQALMRMHSGEAMANQNEHRVTQWSCYCVRAQQQHETLQSALPHTENGVHGRCAHSGCVLLVQPNDKRCVARVRLKFHPPPS